MKTAKALAKRKCPTCQTEFEPDNYRQIYCSRECRPTAYKLRPLEKHRCVSCRKEFAPNIGKQKFCNANCKERYYYRKRSNCFHKEKVCPTCGNTFMQAHGRQKFCVDHMRKQSYTKEMRHERHMLRKYAPNSMKNLSFRKPRTKRQCITCRKEFMPSNGRQKFCHVNCRSKHYYVKRITRKSCIACGKIFMQTHGRQKYCADHRKK